MENREIDTLISYYVRLWSDGMYEVIKTIKKIDMSSWSHTELSNINEVVFTGRISDCESFINLDSQRLIKDD